MNNNGVHVLADIYTSVQVSKPDLVELIESALEISGMSILGRLGHDFGVADAFTAMWLLAESHFTIHTYPELNYISIDCYTCGHKAKPAQAVAILLDGLEVTRSSMKIIARGGVVA